jgi:hypothetical protein
VVSFSTVVNYGWAAKLSGPSTGSEWFNAVACDASGNIYAVGQETSSTGNNEAYITKWDSSGNLTWQRRIGGSSDDLFNAITSDSSGNIYAVGYEFSSTGNNYAAALLTKWDATGNLIWQRKIDGQYHDEFYSVACDSSGNIYAAGRENTTNATYGGLVTKWDASGNLTWQRRIEGCNVIYGVAVDSSGNIYLGGVNSSYNNAILIKINSSGSILWQNKLSHFSNVSAYIRSVVCDSSGNIYAAGHAGYSSPLTEDGFITKWDSSGGLTYQHRMGGTDYEYNYGVAIDSSGNAYTVGTERTTSFPDYNATIVKWPANPANITDGALTGSGMTALSINTSPLTLAASSLTIVTPALTAATPTLTVATTTLTVSTDTLTRYFSTY